MADDLNNQHDFVQIAASMHSVYESKAEQFDRERAKHLFEEPWLDKFAEHLPANARILDLGCGSGEPIAKYFIDRGHAITGYDYSEAMISIATGRFPDHRWIVGDMRSLDLGETFDGVLGWHSFFHLTRDEQRLVIPRFAKHLRPKAPLLLTIGEGDGEVIGHVGGELVYHSSLTLDEYRQLLKQARLEILEVVFEDKDCGGSSILLAQKL